MNLSISFLVPFLGKCQLHKEQVTPPHGDGWLEFQKDGAIFHNFNLKISNHGT